MMILREIGMDLPFIKKEGISNNESIHLYEATWKEKRMQFQLASRCMTAMIERLMPVIKTRRYWKLLIECVSGPPREGCVDLMGVCVVQVEFNEKAFFAMKSPKKKEYIIELVMSAVDSMLAHGNTEFEEIRHTCEEIIRHNYLNEWLWKKPVRFKGKFVQIKVLHEIECVSIYMVFKDYNNELLKEVLLIEDIPDEWIYNKYFGKLEWLNEKEAQLTAKDGTVYIGSC